MPRTRPAQPTADSEHVSTLSVPINKLLPLLDSGDWEVFLEEAAEGAQPKYAHIDRMGGAGDRGRDLVCYLGNDRSTALFDLIQCKRYDRPLSPATIAEEIAKLCVQTWKRAYRMPERYLFAAPHGLSPQSLDLLANPEALRARLVADWPKRFEKGLSDGEQYPLIGPLRAHVDTFDLTRIAHLSVNELISQHKRTPHWHVRFRRDPPERPIEAPVVPAEVSSSELKYVAALVAAYAEEAGVPLTTVAELDGHGDIRSHFRDCRVDFYMAESLNRFYRDKLFQGAFEQLKEDLHSGIAAVVSGSHRNGFQRLLATLMHVVVIQLPDTQYKYCVRPADRKGICHHLANDERVKWVK